MPGKQRTKVGILASVKRIYAKHDPEIRSLFDQLRNQYGALTPGQVYAMIHPLHLIGLKDRDRLYAGLKLCVRRGYATEGKGPAYVRAVTERLTPAEIENEVRESRKNGVAKRWSDGTLQPAKEVLRRLAREAERGER